MDVLKQSTTCREEAQKALKRGVTPACGSRLSLCTPPGGCSATAPSEAVACPSARQHSGWGGWLGLPIRFFRSGSLFMFSCCRARSVRRDFHLQCDLASPDAPSRSCRSLRNQRQVGACGLQRKNRGCRPGTPTGHHGTPTTCEYTGVITNENPPCAANTELGKILVKAPLYVPSLLFHRPAC